LEREKLSKCAEMGRTIGIFVICLIWIWQRQSVGTEWRGETRSELGGGGRGISGGMDQPQFKLRIEGRERPRRHCVALDK
jgi:hypothetical protein